MTTENPFEADDIREAKTAELDNSRPLDVHRWSEYPEVNGFVEMIYERHFSERKAEIARTHLKVLLLDLYVSWFEDRTRYTAIHRSPNAYAAKSRYNELHISRKTIDVVDTLVEAGLLEQQKGFLYRESGVGRLTRVRPSEKLAEEFRRAKFSPFHVASSEKRLSIILRDRDPDDLRSRSIEYESTDHTVQMTNVMDRYNALLARTFIDIPTLGYQGADHDMVAGDLPWFSITPFDRFVARIFNRGSFECGGRFYGGWWQTAPKPWRQRIFINDRPTTEIDFSGLHIVLLYAERGIPYWDSDDAGDPYQVELPLFLDGEPTSREAVKSLTLVALNAPSERAAFRAFRAKAATGSPFKRYTDRELHTLLKAIEDRHPTIADMLCSDAGIWLMRRDSDIASVIVESFTARRIPILTVHDSYVVPTGHEDMLILEMGSAFQKVTGVPLASDLNDGLKEVSERVEDMKQYLLAMWQPYPGYDLQEERAALRARTDPPRSRRYLITEAAFQQWLADQKTE